MPKPIIFVSHTAKEKELAVLLKQEIIKDFLGAVDLFVSSDGKSIQAGNDWLQQVKESLNQSKLELILCSKESVGRPWVNFEAGAGWIRGIPIIPVCHSGLHPNDLPIPLTLMNGVVASEADSLQALYERVAKLLDMQVPNVNFDVLAAKIKSIETTLKRTGQETTQIENPRILCAASEQYMTLGFEKDVAMLEKAFPGRVTVTDKLTAMGLRELLAAEQTERFDIVHLVVSVHPRNGDLIFSTVDLATNMPLGNKLDKMTAAGFAKLVAEHTPQLVVLATCWASSLGIEVARYANVISSHLEITGDEVEEWGECFYGMLAKGNSIYKSFDHTRLNLTAPLQLHSRKDVAFLLRK